MNKKFSIKVLTKNDTEYTIYTGGESLEKVGENLVELINNNEFVKVPKSESSLHYLKTSEISEFEIEEV